VKFCRLFLVSWMGGNAGHVIELMYILGGASGAALPAVVVRTMPCGR